MPVTVVAGGQYGSEGKGKIAHYMALEQRANVAVRVGGSNSGHTVIDTNGNPHVFKQLPTAAIIPDVICVIAAGSYIDVDVLLAEIDRHKIDERRVHVDAQAYVIRDYHRDTEKLSRLKGRIGSTLSGTGAAVIERVARLSDAGLARNEPRLANFLSDTKTLLRRELDAGSRVILEGTQGYGLSLLHAGHYPKATSRDTTAAAFVSEAGLSPLDVDEVVLAIRAFPIRVAGNSGELKSEITWEQVTRNSGSPYPIVEKTSVTGNVRRVARFDPAIVLEALKANTPSTLALNHVDYCDFECRKTGKLTAKARRLISEIEESIARRVDLIGFGPEHVMKRDNEHLTWLKTA